MHLFKFYVDTIGVLVMKYKKSAVDAQWLPQNRSQVRLWKEDADGRPTLLVESPKPVPFKPMWGSEVPNQTGNPETARKKARKATKRKNFMKSGLQKYINYCKNGMSKYKGFATAFGPYVEY
jgi:hypothetical protein